MSKKKGTQVGNFIVTSEQGTFEHIKVTTVSGNWSMRIRSDMQMYHFIKQNLNEETKAYFESYFSICYTNAISIMDLPYMEQWSKAYNELMERSKAKDTELTKEQDDVILDEERKAYEEAHKEEIKTEE